MILANFSIYTGAEEEQLLPAVVVTSDGEKWGFINQTGQFVIKPTYDYVTEFNEKGIAIAQSKNGNKNGYNNIYFINKSGNVVSGPFTSYTPEFKNGIAIITTDKKSSVIIDETGNVLLKSKYELSQYSENLVGFYDSTKQRYGIMDLNGKILIPAKYYSVWPYDNIKYIVEVSAGNYSVIDKTGKVLEKLKYYNPYVTSEGLTEYYDDKSRTYGYKLKDGTFAIKPKYLSASMFRDGYAIVSISHGEYGQRYGIINKKDEFIVKPEYSGITPLGHGLFAVSKNFNLYNTYILPKALMNIKGELLTDYKFFRVSNFDGEYATACDNTSTYFIDQKGNIADNLPQLKGSGQMEIIGDIIKAEVNYGLSYFNKNGEIIWQKQETTPLSDNISVNKIKYRRDYLTYIEYPEVLGMKDKNIQDSVNAKLKKYFIDGYENNPVEIKSNTYENPTISDDEYYEDVSINFYVDKNKDLLIITESGYIYPLGAAHGLPSESYLYIDTKTGAFYQLKDLFKSNSKYAQKLTSIVNNQMSLNKRIGDISGEISYFVDKVDVSAEQPFIIGKDSLKVYYAPYDISSYAAGFIKFEIPYGQLTDIIDTKGAFWNSFDKKIVNKKIYTLSSEIEPSIIKSIESVMSSYEKNIIEAINSNNFTKVEGCLLKVSNLYNSQKKLVSDLYKKNTKEKLTKYEIYNIDNVYESNQYKAYVIEEVAVKYSGKSYVNKKFNWCYTIKVDSAGNYKLTDISKW